jgi:hypothetical protein
VIIYLVKSLFKKRKKKRKKIWLPGCCPEQNTLQNASYCQGIVNVLPGKTGQQTGNSGQLEQLGNQLPGGPKKLP